MSCSFQFDLHCVQGFEKHHNIQIRSDLIRFFIKFIFLGFDMLNDINSCKEVMPRIEIARGRYFDLKKLRKNWRDDENPAEWELSNSLAHLVQICFKKPLDKRETMSLWWLRPLRPEQLIYAGLDAYSVIEVCEYIQAKIGAEKFEWLIRNCPI